ncbi:MAG TPA: hypothetical protein VFQ62_15230 [Methylomirabilota bacterium]|nr:hypothetical protein [Methylomirabilota bacterium]
MTIRWQPSARGVVVGAGVGAVGRAAVLALHLADLDAGAAPLLLLAAAIGAAIGAVAGLMGRPLAGALVGATLTAVVFALTLPVAYLFTLIGAGSVPSLVATVGMGAVSGLAGGAAAQRAAGNRRWPGNPSRSLQGGERRT